jgi:hypothetical protein
MPTLCRRGRSGKHDGFRFICRREGDRVRVFSRHGVDHTDRAPAITEALLALRVKSMTIDGEGVVCGPDGVTDFNRQQPPALAGTNVTQDVKSPRRRSGRGQSIKTLRQSGAVSTCWSACASLARLW